MFTRKRNIIFNLDVFMNKDFIERKTEERFLGVIVNLKN